MSVYSATSHEPNETTKFYLVDFARSRGDSMQFRKVFRQIKKQFTKVEGKIFLMLHESCGVARIIRSRLGLFYIERRPN